MKLVREYIIFEKFHEDDLDPIKDMEIGLKHKIEKWINDALNGKISEYGSIFWVYDYKMNRRAFQRLDISNIKINDDLKIDVYGCVDVSGKHGTNLPNYIRFNHVWGVFACSFSVDKYEELIPKYVEGDIRYYMNPYPSNVNDVIEKIKNVCNVGGDIKILH